MLITLAISILHSLTGKIVLLTLRHTINPTHMNLSNHCKEIILHMNHPIRPTRIPISNLILVLRTAAFQLLHHTIPLTPKVLMLPTHQVVPPVSGYPSAAHYTRSIGNESNNTEPAPISAQTFHYDSNYQPSPENVAEAHKATRKAIVSGKKFTLNSSSYGFQSSRLHIKVKQTRSLLHLLERTLDRVQLQSPETPFAVADLGCSCGGNTIYIVDVIIKHISKRYETNGYDPPEFSAFFSDLPSNDFNTLFQLLPPLAINGAAWRNASPLTATALTSLPVPEIVMDKRSQAYNKGRVFIHGAGESTVNAYKKQFQTDLEGFLRSRSHEMKKGGSKFLVWLGRTSVDPFDQGGACLLFGTHFQDSWDDLVQEGLVESEKRDSFNMPVYAPSLQDFKEVVEVDGSFAINKLEVLGGGRTLVVSQPDDEAEAKHAQSMLHLLESTLVRVQQQPPDSPFAVADLGCSCGGNTIYIIDFIIKHISKCYEANGYDLSKFSAFFSDLPFNDFNTLFQLLPPLAINRTSMEECLAADGHRSYFSAGVPGSFFRPDPSMCSTLLSLCTGSLRFHRVPEMVMDERSAAYNKGRVFIHNAGESTVNAYKKQFQADLARFPRLRSHGMKKAEPCTGFGLAFLVVRGGGDAMEQSIFKGSIVVKARDKWEVQFIYFLFLDFDMQSIEILLKHNRISIDMICDSHISISRDLTTSSIQPTFS
ncbi:hypothetical protein NE237_001482 [Protea cynaroides]|uniref:Uncharacterized protein n=1 Tax=Protea cynaroides TaxID=273540 RepID=A0A9Q0KTE8_9MAGN|nr:hypothetical protein NE237_001482 [Protea cynaroides]